MPKVPKNDKKKKFNPLENEDDNDSEEFDVNDQDEEIPLIQKLNNGSKEERIFACHMFAKLFQDEDDDEKLNKHFESGAIKILIATMSDTQSIVRISATGALRNFSSNCDSKGIKRLIDEDIFLPITTYFQRLKIDVKINNEEIRTQLFDHLTQLVALLSNICESSDESILKIIENGILETIVKYLHPTLLLPDSLLIEVGELLQTISDCNEKVVVYLQKNQPLFQILNDNLKLENQNQYLKSLIIGTLFNIYETNPQQKYAFFQMCFPFFQKVLSVESLPSLLNMKEYLIFLCQINSVEVHEKGDNKDNKDDKEDIEKESNQILNNNETNNNNNNNNNDNEGNMIIEGGNKNKLTENEIKEQEYTKKLDDWKSFTDAQRNTLEIITNFLSIDDSENENSINLPNNILNLIYTPNFLSDILKKCGNPAELIEFESILETDPELVRYTDCLFVVQQRALSLYNNILLFIPIKDNKTVQYIWDFYLNVIDQSIKNENLSSPEQLSLTISGLSSILRSYQNINLKQEHLLLIVKVLELNYDYTDVVVSSLSLLGFFGQIKAFNNHLKQIGDILLNFLKNDSIPIILESLNSIFDIFAEESQVFKQTNMFNALAQCLKVLQNKKQNLKSEMKQNDLDEEDDEEIILEDIEESIQNLENFLKYKKN